MLMKDDDSQNQFFFQNSLLSFNFELFGLISNTCQAVLIDQFGRDVVVSNTELCHIPPQLKNVDLLSVPVQMYGVRLLSKSSLLRHFYPTLDGFEMCFLSYVIYLSFIYLFSLSVMILSVYYNFMARIKDRIINQAHV